MLIGIVGKANVGKSTFFKAATLADAEIANFPFTTIKPNHGIGFIRIKCVDAELDVKCKPKEGFCIKNERFVPVELLDVAGLVPGAYQGRGMGNQFLDDLRQASVLIHIVDASGSTNEMGEPVQPGTNDPVKDVLFLEEELDMWYFQILKKSWDKFSKQAKMEHLEAEKAIAKQFSGLNVTEAIVKNLIKGLNLNEMDAAAWSEEQLKDFAKALRKITKPMLIAANKVDTKEGRANYEILLKEFPDYRIIPCSAESELALKEAAKLKMIEYIPGDSSFNILAEESLNQMQKEALNFIKKNVLDVFNSTGVQQTLNTAVLELLNYVAVFPVANPKLQDQSGNVLPDCFLMPSNSTAHDLAYKVHTSIGQGFIKAIDMKKRTVVGKDYHLRHRDVIEIVV